MQEVKIRKRNKVAYLIFDFFCLLSKILALLQVSFVSRFCEPANVLKCVSAKKRRRIKTDLKNCPRKPRFPLSFSCYTAGSLLANAQANKGDPAGTRDPGIRTASVTLA